MIKSNSNKLSDNQIKTAAMMYLDGNSFRKIADYFTPQNASEDESVSHVTIRKYLTKDLFRIDYLLFREVGDSIIDNQPRSISKQEVVDRVLACYDMFVNRRMSVLEIAQSLNVSFYTIYRDLDKRLENMYVAKKGGVTKQMVEKVQLLMAEHRLKNLTPGSDAYLTEKRENGRFAG